MAKKSETMNLEPLPMEPAFAKALVSTGVYRLNEHVNFPAYQTNAAGCFDLAADLSTHHYYLKFWDAQLNREGQKKVREDSTGRYILLEPGDRVLVPTGLVFVFPAGHSMKTFIRSSVGLKKGLMLANSVGYIDEDYRNEVFLPIINTSRAQVRIDNQERIAQGEIGPASQTDFEELDAPPSLSGNRTGGFGSTEKK